MLGTRLNARMAEGRVRILILVCGMKFLIFNFHRFVLLWVKEGKYMVKLLPSSANCQDGSWKC